MLCKQESAGSNPREDKTNRAIRYNMVEAYVENKLVSFDFMTFNFQIKDDLQLPKKGYKEFKKKSCL